ncbi:MAG: response regulator [Chloroflexi bacterium]|nr:response regulator [Chloroflexota bacterium]
MTQGTGDRPLEVLLVEGNPSDAASAEETIKSSEHISRVTIAENGDVAMSMLRREGEHASAPRPDLILLDLHLPDQDGLEVLKEISADEELAQIPLVMLLATEAEQSLLNSYDIPPSRYWRKPIRLQRFDMAINQLETMRKEPIKVYGPRPRPVLEPIGAASGGGRGGEQPKKRRWWPFG